MRAAKVLAWGMLLVMLGILAYAFREGSFVGDGGILLGLPWGREMLVEVYVGLALFAGWVIHREHSPWRSAVWILLLACLGNLAAALYAVVALHQSRGDWNRFWRGRRAGKH